MLGFIMVYGMVVYKLEFISVVLFLDNVNFMEVGEKYFIFEEIFCEGIYVEDLKFDLGMVKVRYVCVIVCGVGKCFFDYVCLGQEV